MKVLQIVPSISLVYGGPSQMALGLSKALAQAGVELTLLTTNTNGDAGQPPLDVPLQQPIEQDGYTIIYFPCSPFRRYKFSLPLLDWLNKHAQEYDLAHIHALFSPISTAAATVARNQGLPYILRPLGTLDPADLRKKKWLKQVYGYLWERPNLAGAAGVHFTSEQEQQISQRFGTDTKDLLIPLGVELPGAFPPPGKIRQQLGIDQKLPLILFMSRIDQKKGLDLLIPALIDLAQTHDFHFVLAGANPQDAEYETQIKQQINNSVLEKRTTITGFVRDEIKLGLLTDADMFVLPSYYENFGIAVAEAMFAGTPVVVSQGVHIWQQIEAAEAGWICSTSIDSLKQQLDSALADPKECMVRGARAKAYAQSNFSWSAIAQKLIRVYQQCVDHTPA